MDAIDANLERTGQETTGVYRQRVTRDGGIVLQAPLKDLPHAD